MVGGGQGELSADNMEEVLEAEMGSREGIRRLPWESRWEVTGSPGVFLTCPTNLGCVRSWVSHRGFSVIRRVPPDECECH